MRRILFCFTLFLLIATNFVWGRSSNPVLRTEEDIRIKAVVKQVGVPPDRDSGDVEVYQLVKYEVSEVLQGKYDEKYIVIDHLILKPDELKELKVGDKVCLSATKSKTIGMRYDADGIRNTSVPVKFFYISSNSIETCSHNTKGS